jgi:phosphate transport system protein
MRKIFYKKLDEINQDVLNMGSLVQDAIHNSVKAMLNMDPQLAEKIIEGDEKINEYDILIEEKCIIIQAEYQPVAFDLRFLHSVSMIVKSLERIGDLAVNIARIIKRLSKIKDKKRLDKDIIGLLIEMGDLVKVELANAMKAFRHRDAKLASRLGKSDDPIDKIQKIIFKKLFTVKKEKEDITFITDVALAGRYLERMGDQSVNIGDRILYFLTGDYTVSNNNS